MAARESSTWQIGVVPPERWPEALRLAFSHLPPEMVESQVSEVLAGAKTSEGSGTLEGLFEARRPEGLCGVVWAQPRPGRTAGLIPPRCVDSQSAACADALLQAAIDWLASRGTVLVQTLVEDRHGAEAELLFRAGFTHLAELLYLISLDQDFPAAPPADERLTLIPATELPKGRLAALVERTYQQTRDCPALDGVRSVDDVLADYRANGRYDPAWWLVARHEAEDVGCLLLNDHPDVGHAELVYMGLVPEARGRGWGVLLTQHAQWCARSMGRERLMLAVDAANEPALAAYAAAGFFIWQQRSAMVRIFAQ